jgi:hypothetical protein
VWQVTSNLQAGCLILIAGAAITFAAIAAAIAVVNFLAVSIPAVIAGWAATRYGLHRTALVYCAVVAVLAAAAAGSLIVRSHAPRTPSTASDRGE